MNAEEIKQHLSEAYFRLLEQQEFMADSLDYTVLERHKPSLQKLAEIGNSVISVFDLYQKRHVFNSFNLGEALGYKPQDVLAGGESFLDAKIHPDDFVLLMQHGVMLLKFFRHFPKQEKKNYKLISEYRVLNSADKYVRVIEQQQALEITENGSIWLALSILDISPNQKSMDECLTCELLNFKTGNTIPFQEEEENIKAAALSQREIEILKFVKDGLLSKEISDKLAISVHTVNTHRQRVLDKLGAKNSMEAVMLATRLGIV